MNEQVKEVAYRMKELREIMEIPAEELAKNAGIDCDVYLNYETAKTDIPISAIYAVASALSIDPTVLLSGESPRMTTYTVVRGGKGMRVERNPEYSFSSLAFNFKDRDMEPMIVSLMPKKETPELVTHGGQEFNYVLEGKVTVIYGNRNIVLNAGDSIYFDPKVPHGQISTEGPAKFITVINE